MDSNLATTGSGTASKAKFTWPLATTLTLSFGSVTLAAVGFVLIVAFTSGSRTARDLLASQAVQLVGTVSHRIQSHLGAARDHAEFMSRRLVEEGLVEPGRETALVDALRNSLAAAPQIAGTVYVDDRLRAFDVDRIDEGLRTQVSDWSDYDDAVAAMRVLRRIEEGYWAEPVFVPDLGQAVVNYRVPVRDGSRFLGGLVTTITTTDLDRFVTQIARPHDAVGFILVGPDEVLAYSGSDHQHLYRSEERPLPALSSVPDMVLRNLWDEKVGRRLPVSDQLPGFEVRIVHQADGDYIVVYEHLGGVGPVPWVVGCYFRAEDLIDAFDRIAWSLIAGVLMLALALVGVFLVGRKLSRPIVGLAQAAATVGSGGPTGAPVLPSSRLREISQAAHGFNDMVTGLREREQLKETFGKYVPASVADAIVAQGGTIEPQSRMTTTLFTDIAGFSTVAEGMSPEHLIDMLNEYFAAVAEPLESHGGVIHQFQGDAILATFNLPVPHEDHAAQAEAIAGLAAANGRPAPAADPIPWPRARTPERVRGPGLPWAALVGAFAAMALAVTAAVGTLGGAPDPATPEDAYLGVRATESDTPRAALGLSGVASDGGTYEVVASGEVAASDWLRLTVTAHDPALRHVAVVGLQLGRPLVWYAPAEPGAAAPDALEPGTRTLLADEVALQAPHVPGALTVLAVFAAEPVDLEALEAALGDPLPADISTLRERLVALAGAPWLGDATAVVARSTEIVAGARSEAPIRFRAAPTAAPAPPGGHP